MKSFYLLGYNAVHSVEPRFEIICRFHLESPKISVGRKERAAVSIFFGNEKRHWKSEVISFGTGTILGTSRGTTTGECCSLQKQ
jgi:hypothetical protein